MANYSLNDIKALREATGAGMMDVKKALEEANGDREKAVEIIRVKGLKGIAKREGRSASAGLVVAKVIDSAEGQVGVLVEINSETDFVAKNEKFIDFANTVLAAAIESGATSAGPDRRHAGRHRREDRRASSSPPKRRGCLPIPAPHQP